MNKEATMSNENLLRAALISLIKDVNTAGGLVRFTDGLTAPAAEPSWTELGATILLAHEALKADGVVIGLHSYDVDTTSEYPNPA
jgi:hypothetical protein